MLVGVAVQRAGTNKKINVTVRQKEPDQAGVPRRGNGF